MSSTMSTTLLTPTALAAFEFSNPSAIASKLLTVSAASSDSGLSDDGSSSSSALMGTPAGSDLSSVSKVAEEIELAAVTPSAVVPQVQKLMSSFPESTTFSVCTDADTGCMKPCCVAATAYMEGAVAASAARLGLPGVLDVLQAKFAWGPARCWTLCDAMKQNKSDCGSMMNLALTALRLAPTVVSNDVKLVKVQYIRRWNAFQAAESKGRYSEVAPSAEKDFLQAWISTDVYYHQCVGLVKLSDGTNSVRIWDWGKWHMPPTDYAADRAIVAIKLTIDGNDGAAAAAANEPELQLDWHGLVVPTGQWVTLLPSDVAAEHAAHGNAHGIANVEPLRSGVSEAAKHAILQSVFADHSMSAATAVVGIATPAAAPTMAVAELAPTVYIGGNHMSHNPCPGVGVSRALRLRFPDATTVAVDNASDPLSGMVDTTFSRTVGVDVVMNLGNNMSNASKSLQWDLIESMLSKDSSAFYLPCSDALIDSISESLARQDEHVQAELGPRILAPPVSAVEATEKPAIAGAKATGLFEVPPFMTLDADTRSATDIEEWCKVHGYPVLVKGPVQGATLCSKWCEVHAAISSSWGSGGYVQKCATGFQMGLAYAAYEGELTAAVLMEKTAYVGSKAWGGNLRPVPPLMLQGLKDFCKEHNWTGGGELEYIEDVEGIWHAIDWNPRFPAWIFGGCYAGVNLPAALVQHALHKQSGGAVPFPTDVAEACASAYGGFTRTCVEIPSFHTQQHALAGFPGFVNAGITSGKAGATVAKTPAKMNMLPKDIKLGPQLPSAASAAAEEGADDETLADAEEEKIWLQGSAEPDLAARETLAAELNALIPEDTSELQTPAFVLSRSTVRNQLNGHKAAVQKALDATGAGAPELKMCLSVKTQPHPVVLAEARAAGYLGEVITSAEMHACLDAGWAPNEIVMNGPGKWYGDMSGPRSNDAKPTAGLRCLFADSIADLKTIVSRITDPEDWLDAEIIGCRFSPVAVTTSRFGMNCKDPQVLLQAAELLSQLPVRIKIGVHMHFASSTLGLQQWFGVAQGYLRVAINFEQLLDSRKLSVLDFGGGWPSHLLDHEETHSYLVKLFAETRAAFPALEAVQFEPGKSITERAGAVLTKVIEIREMERKMPDGAPVAADSDDSSSDNEDDDDDDDDLDEHGDKKVDKKGSQNRAAVVDACISDMGSMPLHVHPLVWQEGEGEGNWSSVEQGKDQLWGSICMEFDVLGAAFKLPKNAAVGDHVLIAFTGAYDTTMAYDFADGKARDMLVV